MEPLTEEARAALPDGRLTITRWPFRIGRRADRHPRVDNELALLDQPPFHVSRSHCVLAALNGRCVVLDRGSRRGTYVNGQPLGLGGATRLELDPGEHELALGAPPSPFRFRVVVAPGRSRCCGAVRFRAPTPSARSRRSSATRSSRRGSSTTCSTPHVPWPASSTSCCVTWISATS
ncbi:MAG: FHA domain-containing protein [Candidatus Rokubacteria bacterium]|nr:FHA domain-containing protein [Candidatus Rokubacteria bacterium]